MMKKFIAYIFFTIITALISCTPKLMNTIEGVRYEESDNTTNYFVIPYGNVKMPGKWDKSYYNSVSFQQFFTNKDSVRIAVALGAYNKYEFNVNGAKKGFEFVKSFYEWDSQYFVEKYGLNRSIVEEDSINNFIIWRLYGTVADKDEFDSYFLFGENKGQVSNFSIMKTDKWELQHKIDFLKNLYLAKKEE